ncbi:MAG: class I SAM-dependent methyltransferase [Candidatus Acidiferrales bacterium]
MARKAVLVITLCLAVLVQAQEQRQPPREVWNDVFTKRQGREFPHNKFLAEMIKGRKPGKALDIGMGEGRNALYLAAQGWEVTGFDISDVGVKQGQEEARKRGLKLEAFVEDVDRFDYGKERWDLVVGIYMHGLITRNANKITDSLRPGGIVVIEGFHRDINRETITGESSLGYGTNELLMAFDRLRVLYYEDTMAPADWGRGQPKSPIVRFLATKNQAAP